VNQPQSTASAVLKEKYKLQAEKLLGEGGTLACKDEHSNSLLHFYATREAPVELLEVLISKGAVKSSKQRWRNTVACCCEELCQLDY
jgi:hypothetical protein